MEFLEGKKHNYAKMLSSVGLTNRTTEDIGKIATGQVKEYHMYCSSMKCCYVNGINKNYVFKKTTNVWINTCPDCGGILFNRRRGPK